MRRCEWFYTFSNYRGIFFLRKVNSSVTAATLQCFQVQHCVARQRSDLAQEKRPLQIRDGVNTAAASSSSLLSSSCDDDDLVKNICRVLYLRLPIKKETQMSCNSDEMITLHTLFSALGPSLRLQLQNSSFGALIKVLKSRPDWFILSADDSKVGLTTAARSWQLDTESVKDVSTNTTARSSLARGESRLGKGAIETTKSSVVVRGLFSSTSLDVSKPPLTSAEVEKWKLTRLLLSLGLYFLVDKEPRTLYPHGEKPRQLSSELAEAEALYMSKGLFSPSEVAAAFVHITPTFFVETRHVLAAMSPDIAWCFEQHISKDRVVDGFFKKYPMIFKLKTGKFQKAAVKLNIDFDFITNYPGCGRADRLLRRYSQEHRATVGGVISPLLASSSSTPSSYSGDVEMRRTRAESNIDLRIFRILLRNLPRAPSEPGLSKEELETKRCKPFALVEWIESFSQEDLDVLNSAPQQRVLTILTRYSHIFQLISHGEDPNLFTEHVHLEMKRKLRFMQPSYRKAGLISNNDRNNNATVSHSITAHELCNFNAEKEMTGFDGKNLEVGSQNLSSQSTNEIKKREATLAAALRDDLISVDEILGCSSETHTSCSGLNDKNTAGICAELGVHDNNAHFADCNHEDIFTSYKNDDEQKEDEGNERGENYGNSAIIDVNSKKGETCDAEQIHLDDEWEQSYIPSRYDIIYVRRLPKRIAPRSLSDYNATNSPEPELVQHIASFLNPPPSMQSGRNGMQFGKASQSTHCFAKGVASGHWRWVPIQRIYASLSGKQKRLLRPYKGLVHFIRLHGEVFELSMDFLHVIAHDPQGQVVPFFPTQTVFCSEDRVLLSPTFDDDEHSKASLIGDAERDKFGCILGASQVPTDRPQLLLLDPLNPLLDHDVLCEEVSFFMPDHPVSLHQLMARLPPILKAALPLHHKNSFKTSKHLTVWTENGRMMLQKSQLAVPTSAMACEKLTVEDAVECVREIIPDDGIIIGHLNRMLPGEAKTTLKEHFGNLYNAILGYPQYFYLEKVEGNRSSSTVFLVERIQENE